MNREIKEKKCKICGGDTYIGLDGKEIHSKYLGKTMPQKEPKEKIIEILRGVMSASENRDWGREAHCTKRELEIMRNNNDNDFLQIADQILALFEAEKEKWGKEIEKTIVELGKSYIIQNSTTPPDSNIVSAGVMARKNTIKHILEALKKELKVGNKLRQKIYGDNKQKNKK